MVDYAFIRIKNNFLDAKNIADSPSAEIFEYGCIQIGTTDTILQITNVSGGISFGGNYQVHIVDCSNTELLDITNNVFIQEFTNDSGVNQIAFEVVNINKDFYRQDVYFRFTHTLSDAVYFSNPLNITDYEINKTVFFEYKNYTDFDGIGYTNSQKYQAIRLRMYFDIPIDESEVQNYFQVTQGNTISARVLEKLFYKYQVDYINSFTYTRLNKLLKHNVIYIDCVRLTDKPIVSSEDREGSTNWFTTNFIVAKDFNDTKQYDYQIYQGMQAVQFLPSGAYTLANLPTDGKILFTTNITLNTGTITLYDSNDNIVGLFNETQLEVTDNRIDIGDITNLVLSNGVYYFHISEGLVSGLGEDYIGINDNITWTFTVQNPDYSSADYGTDYLTN